MKWGSCYGPHAAQTLAEACHSQVQGVPHLTVCWRAIGPLVTDFALPHFHAIHDPHRDTERRQRDGSEPPAFACWGAAATVHLHAETAQRRARFTTYHVSSGHFPRLCIRFHTTALLSPSYQDPIWSVAP